MSRIAVLGAGVVGSAAAWDLARRGHEIVIGDTDPSRIERAEAELGVAESAVIDAAAESQVAAFIGGAEILVSAVSYRLGESIARIALDARCHYLDFGGNPTVVARQLEFDGAAREAGIAVVPDCGLAPGLANVLAVDDVAVLGPGPVDRVALRVGALPAEPAGVLGYQLAFSAEGLINEYDEPCDVLRNGRYVTVEPLSEFETLDWPGWGPLEAFHTAGGSSSLPRKWEGLVRELDYKTLRYPGHGIVFKALRELGMFSESPGEYGGVESTPRRVLTDVLARHLPRGEDDVVLVRTWATAQREGRTRTTGRQLVDRHDGRFSALARTTAFPATALAHLLTQGFELAGARTMDAAIEAQPLMAELAPLGITTEPWPA